MHPGGLKKIKLGVGKDSTVMFHKFHKGIRLELTPLPGLKLGEIPALKPQSGDGDQKVEAPPNDSKNSKESQESSTGFLAIPGLKIGLL